MDAIENYDLIRTLATGNGGRVARLMRYKPTNELLAVKFIPRGEKIDRHVAREIINHRSLRHPNIVLFRRAFLTPTHLAIAMDFAAGGELLDLIGRKAPLPEDEARFFFQQLIAGVGYLHSMHVFHRDLKLDNIVLDSRGENPRLKICDFGHSKSGVLHSRPNSMVGTPSYIAPEVLTGKEYDGGAVDVWSCGVILYLMVVGEYPFQDEEDRNNIKKIVERILAVQYRIPDECGISLHCKQLISSMLVKDPRKRIRIEEIRKHPWFVKNLAGEVGEDEVHGSRGLQSVAEITKIVEEARRIPIGLTAFETLKIKEAMEVPKMRPKKCRSTG